MTERDPEHVERLGDWVLASDGKLYPPGIEFGSAPVHPSLIPTDANLALWAAEEQFRAQRDEKDPHAMTADKLAERLRRDGKGS